MDFVAPYGEFDRNGALEGLGLRIAQEFACLAVHWHVVHIEAEAIKWIFAVCGFDLEGEFAFRRGGWQIAHDFDFRQVEIWLKHLLGDTHALESLFAELLGDRDGFRGSGKALQNDIWAVKAQVELLKRI